MQITGTIYWAKLDKPRDNYNKQRKIMKDGEPDRWGREYSVVFGNLSKDTKIALRDAGLLDKVKNKMDDQEDHITFRLNEFDRDGDSQEILVTDAETMQPWDWEENGLIGNGSKGVIKFNIWSNPSTGKKNIYPVSVLVTELVEYEAPEGSMEYEDPNDWSEYAKPQPKAKVPAKAKPGKKAPVDDDFLEDEIPF